MVEVFSELRPETIQKRWEHVNVILRMSMLTGLQMQLDATLNLLCDMAADISPFDKAIGYFLGRKPRADGTKDRTQC